MDKVDNKSMIGVAVLQIVACMGVLNGHFLGYFCAPYIEYLRSSMIKNTVLSYFYMGDLNVQLFFVLGGFLIPISSAGKSEFTYKSILKKWLSLMAPAIVLTTLVFGVLKFSSVTQISYLQYADDLSIYLTGATRFTQKEQSHIPYILSQLWFLFPYFKGWVVAYCVHHSCKNKGIFELVICSVLVCLLGMESKSVLIGLLFGEIALQYKFNNKRMAAMCLALGSLCICPFIFSSPNLYSKASMKLIMIILFGVVFWTISGLKIKSEDKIERYVVKLSSLTMEVYYVHWIIILVGAHIYRNYFPTMNLILIYMMVVLITIIFSVICRVIVFDPIGIVTQKALNLLN